MHLVYIGSQEEGDFLEFKNPLYGYRYVWIGLSAVTWLDNSTLTYANFGKTTSTFDDGGTCFMMNSSASFQWLDDDSSNQHYYICEKEVESTTFTPTTSQGCTDVATFSSLPATDTTSATSTTGTSKAMATSPISATHTTQAMATSPISATRTERAKAATAIFSAPVAAHKRSNYFKMLVNGATLVDVLVHSSYTASTVIACGHGCLNDSLCSCFTYIAQDRTCLLAESCPLTSQSGFEKRPGAIEFDGSLYHFSRNSSDFYTSKVSCEDLGMHLVSIESKVEQDFLVSNLPDNSSEYWIGLDTCNPGLVEFHGSCYHFSGIVSNYNASKALCESMEMHLVYIGSQEEQDFLDINQAPYIVIGTWIGLSDVTWLDGSSLTYANFGITTSTFDDGGTYFVMSSSSSFRWLDDDGSNLHYAICEKEGVPCDPTQIEYGGSCYYFSQNQTTYHASKLICENRGMHLIYIGSQEEGDFLELNGPLYGEVWIGLSAVTWQDNSTLTYANFGKTTSTFDDGGTCFVMNSSASFQWLDDDSSNQHYFICEKEVGELA
eukprot:XP_003731299.2 PREDICTED: lymphocyte antigen 75-like [Strongylocentrotus purpuratus]